MFGCTTAYTPPDYSNVFAPPAPELKRVQLLNIIRTDLDIRRPTFSEELFGESAAFAFTKPFCAVSDNDGNIYVSDSYLDTIFLLNPDKGYVKTLDQPRKWKKPKHLAIDNKNGLLGLIDERTALVLDIRTAKQAITIKKPIEKPGGIAFDPERKYIYVSDHATGAVYKFNYSGDEVGVIGGKGSEHAMHFPGSMQVDQYGNVFIVEVMNWRIMVFDHEGNFVRSFGGHGDRPGMFGRPKGVGLSKDGVVMVSDADFNRVTLFSETGQPLLIIGGSGTEPGMFITPQCVYIDNKNKFYVVDQSNRRVQIFQLYTDQYYKEIGEAAISPDTSQGTQTDTTPDTSPGTWTDVTPETSVEPETR